MTIPEIIDTTPDNISELGICGYKNPATPGFLEKVNWFKARYAEGLRIKTLYSQEDGNQGMIEYIPGELCWRPVNAAGYIFIHCLFSGFKKKYKGYGYASMLIDSCEQDAQEQKKNGVAIVTRKSSFMVGKEIFLKRGYIVVDQAEPDFELLVKKFNPDTANPSFSENLDQRSKTLPEGLLIFRADQCPYTVKNVDEIRRAAEEQFNIKVLIEDLKDCTQAQNSPCAFGTFCIAYNQEIIACHPISKTRFTNIMSKRIMKSKV